MNFSKLLLVPMFTFKSRLAATRFRMKKTRECRMKTSTLITDKCSFDTQICNAVNFHCHNNFILHG